MPGIKQLDTNETAGKKIYISRRKVTATLRSVSFYVFVTLIILQIAVNVLFAKNWKAIYISETRPDVTASAIRVMEDEQSRIKKIISEAKRQERERVDAARRQTIYRMLSPLVVEAQSK